MFKTTSVCVIREITVVAVVVETVGFILPFTNVKLREFRKTLKVDTIMEDERPRRVLV